MQAALADREVATWVESPALSEPSPGFRELALAYLATREAKAHAQGRYDRLSIDSPDYRQALEDWRVARDAFDATERRLRRVLPKPGVAFLVGGYLFTRFPETIDGVSCRKAESPRERPQP